MDIWTRLGQFSQLETKDLYLRPFNYSDHEDFYDMTRHPDNMAFIFPTQASLAESDYLLVHYFMKEPLGIWAMEDKQTGRVIGAIRLENLNLVKRTAEVGYFVHRDYWGRGLASQCLKTLSFLSFQEFGLKRLILITHLENVASQAVAKKAGFRLARRYKGSDRYSHKMRDYLEFTLDEFPG